MIKKPEELAQQLGLHFKNPKLLQIALTHRSMGAYNNERLEFLGDSILGFVIAQKLYTQFPEAGEGILSRLRASLVNQESLASVARMHKIGDYLILGSGELKSGGFRRDSILSDTVEAIIGALFKDQGISICEQWVLSLFSQKLKNLSATSEQKDPKTRLQELMQAHRVDLPRYELIQSSGLAHSQVFKIECSVTITEKKYTGQGASRKKAEQQAAEKMLTSLDRKNK